MSVIFCVRGVVGAPCGVRRPSYRLRVLRCLFPRSSVSSTGASSHILTRCSIAPSTILRATDFMSSGFIASTAAPIAPGWREPVPGWDLSPAVDPAPFHGARETAAKSLAPHPKDIVIATKGGWNRPGPNQWTHDAIPEHLRRAVEPSGTVNCPVLIQP